MIAFGTGGLRVRGERGSQLILDGLLVTGEAVSVEGRLAGFTLRHTTLVPGWTFCGRSEPVAMPGPSLVMHDAPQLRVNIENSILGHNEIVQDEVNSDPIKISLADSILDTSSLEPGSAHSLDDGVAHARLTVERSTILGDVRVHTIDLAENSIFQGKVRVARRQVGCMRFCSLAMAPESRTPRRYDCQPDLAERALRETGRVDSLSDAARETAERQERQRVRPRFRKRPLRRPGLLSTFRKLRCQNKAWRRRRVRDGSVP